MSDWYLHRDGAPPFGPITTERVRSGIHTGELPPSTLACAADGQAPRWRPLSSIPELLPEAGGEPATTRRRSTRPPAGHPTSRGASGTMLWRIGGATLALAAGAGLALVLLRRPRSAESRRTAAAQEAIVAPGPAAASAAPTAASDPPPVASAAGSAAPGAPAGRATDPCTGATSLSPPLCRWLAARAAGQASPAPMLAIQAYLAREGIAPVRGRVVRDLGERGLHQVTANGVWGYCLRVEPGRAPAETFSIWARKRPAPETYSSAAGRPESCVALEESELARAMMDLAGTAGGAGGPAPDPAGARALAARALELAAAPADAAPSGAAEEPQL